MKQRRAARTLLAHAAAVAFLVLPLPTSSMHGNPGFLPIGAGPAQAQAQCVVQFVWRCASSRVGKACGMLLGSLTGLPMREAAKELRRARVNCDQCRRERKVVCPGHMERAPRAAQRHYILPAERDIDGRLRPVRPWAPVGPTHREIERERARVLGEFVGRAIGEALGGKSSRGSHYGNRPSYGRGSGHSGRSGGAHIPNEREIERAIGRGIGNMFGGAARNR